MTYPLVWFWRSRLPERKGQRCRVVARGKLNSVLVEFPDGFLVVTSRYAVRRMPSLGTVTVSSTSAAAKSYTAADVVTGKSE